MNLKSRIYLLIFLSNNIVAQGDIKLYLALVHQADSIFHLGEYKKASETYSNAFKAYNWKGYLNDRYNAACSYALAAIPDSAFYNIEKIVVKGHYSNYGRINHDSDLISLHADSRWLPLMEKVKQNKENEERYLNKPLMAQLDSIYDDDQNDRKQLKNIEDKYGVNSSELKQLWKVIGKKDSINLTKVKSILDKYGWLGPEVVGIRGNSTLFLVIQHSDLATQEKYLPLMKEAVKSGKAAGSSLALLVDRVAIGQGKRQVYGSQIGRNNQTNVYYVLPLENPNEVDKRRTEVGLGPISEYVSNWKIVWDIEKYKKDLPMLEEKNK